MAWVLRLSALTAVGTWARHDRGEWSRIILTLIGVLSFGPVSYVESLRAIQTEERTKDNDPTQTGITAPPRTLTSSIQRNTADIALLNYS